MANEIRDDIPQRLILSAVSHDDQYWALACVGCSEAGKGTRTHP